MNNKTLHIMRGVSGAGKSTKVREIIGELSQNDFAIHSTDSVIEREYGGIEGYRKLFSDMHETKDFTRLGEAHNQNKREARKSMAQGIANVIIDNTNLQKWEFHTYVKIGEEFGYTAVIHNVSYGDLTPEELAERNKHGVPVDIINRMITKFNYDPNMTI